MLGGFMSSTATTLKSIAKKAAQTVLGEKLEKEAVNYICTRTMDGVLGGATLGFMVGTSGRFFYDVIRSNIMTHSAFGSKFDYQNNAINAVSYGFMDATITATFIGALAFVISSRDYKAYIQLNNAVQSTTQASQQRPPQAAPVNNSQRLYRKKKRHARNASAPPNLTPVPESPSPTKHPQ